MRRDQPVEARTGRRSRTRPSSTTTKPGSSEAEDRTVGESNNIAPGNTEAGSASTSAAGGWKELTSARKRSSSGLVHRSRSRTSSMLVPCGMSDRGTSRTTGIPSRSSSVSRSSTASQSRTASTPTPSGGVDSTRSSRASLCAARRPTPFAPVRRRPNTADLRSPSVFVLEAIRRKPVGRTQETSRFRCQQG